VPGSELHGTCEYYTIIGHEDEFMQHHKMKKKTQRHVLQISGEIPTMDVGGM
jgi:hypothetical protein